MLLKTKHCPTSQAGRRGFEPRLPLHLFNNLQEFRIPSIPSIKPQPLDFIVSSRLRSRRTQVAAVTWPRQRPIACKNPTRKLLTLLQTNGDVQLDQMALGSFFSRYSGWYRRAVGSSCSSSTWRVIVTIPHWQRQARFYAFSRTAPRKSGPAGSRSQKSRKSGARICVHRAACV